MLKNRTVTNKMEGTMFWSTQGKGTCMEFSSWDLDVNFHPKAVFVHVNNAFKSPTFYLKSQIKMLYGKKENNNKFRWKILDKKIMGKKKDINIIILNPYIYNK